MPDRRLLVFLLWMRRHHAHRFPDERTPVDLIGKLNAFLSKFVGPNAAHMIDALIGLAIVGGISLLSSGAARVFLAHHATLAVIVTAGVPVATALASKFRKAAGDQANLLDQIETIVKDALAAQKAPASK